MDTQERHEREVVKRIRQFIEDNRPVRNKHLLKMTRVKDGWKEHAQELEKGEQCTVLGNGATVRDCKISGSLIVMPEAGDVMVMSNYFLGDMSL